MFFSFTKLQNYTTFAFWITFANVHKHATKQHLVKTWFFNGLILDFYDRAWYRFVTKQFLHNQAYCIVYIQAKLVVTSEISLRCLDTLYHISNPYICRVGDMQEKKFGSLLAGIFCGHPSGLWLIRLSLLNY